MRFLYTLVSLLALTSVSASSIATETSTSTSTSDIHAPYVVTLHESHDHHARFKVLDASGSSPDYVDVPPPPPVVEDTGVIRQNEYNPIGSHDVVVEFSGTPDGRTLLPWTVSVDQAAELFHYSCITGSEDPSTWTQAMGDVLNHDLVTEFFAEFNNYKHPRQIPRVKCVWPDQKYRTQVHLRHLGQRSGDIQCTSSSLVDMAKQMAEVAGCITN